MMDRPPDLDMLDSISIASPCSVPWDQMRGSGGRRFCNECRKTVFDLAEMPTNEVARVLGDAGPLPCVRLQLGPDGRMMTADSPTGLRGKVWRRLSHHAAWAAALFAVLFFPGCTLQGTPVSINPSKSPMPGEAQEHQKLLDDAPPPPSQARASQDDPAP